MSLFKINAGRRMFELHIQNTQSVRVPKWEDFTFYPKRIFQYFTFNYFYSSVLKVLAGHFVRLDAQH